MIASNTVEEVYAAWTNNTDFSFLQSLTPKIYKSSGTNVLATLGTVNKKGIRYLFSNGTNQSGWTDKTHYFFQNADYAKGTTVKAKDEHGNVSGEISVVIDKSSTKETKPELTNTIDFLSQTKYDFWDGFVIHTNSDSLQAKIAQKDGEITLESIHSSWSGQGKKGPFLYKNITGDFTFSAEISDLVGKKEKRNTSTEVGIMVRSAGSSREIHIQNTVLTGWNLGNMTTYTNGGRRVQKNNGTAWNFMKYLQIQKAGEYFYLRASNDNKTWVELPGSPVHSQELSGKQMTLGIFQSSNNNVKGFGSFKSILLTQ